MSLPESVSDLRLGNPGPGSARSAHSVIKIAKTSARTARLILARDLAITVLICFWMRRLM